MRSRILLFVLVVCTMSFGVAQSNFLNLGIERFGLTVEEPFHTAWDLHQDSFGRLVAYVNAKSNETLTFDGYRFHKEEVLSPSESMLMRNDNGGYWKLTDPFIATYVRDSTEISVDVREYLDRNICHLYIHSNHYYLLCNDGYIKFKITDKGVQIIEHHKYPVTRIEKAYFIGDTIYINRGKTVAYILQNEPEHIVYTNEKKTIYNTLIHLTNGRILLPKKVGYETTVKGSRLNQYLRDPPYKENPFLDSKGRLWNKQVSKNELGLFVFIPGATEHREIDLGIEKTNSLNFYEDNLGDIWISTSTQGIIHLFDQSIRLINKSNGVLTDNIAAIHQTSETGNVYVSLNYLGIDILDHEGKSKIGHIQGQADQKSILVDRHNRMWVIAGGLMLVENDKIINYFRKSEGFHSRTVTAIFEDSSGDIWAGTRQVLHKYVNNRFVKHQIPELDVYDRIIGIAELSNKNLLLAIDIGIYYEFDGSTFKKLTFSGVIPNELFTDLDGTIWLATENDGLYHWQNDEFVPAASNEQLQIKIRGLQDSKNGLLFGVCTDNKIFYAKKSDLKTNIDPKSIRWLTIDSGLPLMDSNKKRQPSTAVLSTGEVVFPNVYGAIAIDPIKILAQKEPFRTVVMLDGEVITNRQIELPYGDNDLDLDIRNIYLNPQASYANQYTINGGDWIDLTSKKNLHLKDLSSGINDITIRAKHINGEWLHPSSFSVIVPPLFYERLWFIIGCPALIMLLIYLYTKRRMASIKRRNHELKVLVNEQTKELVEEKKQLAESLINQKDLALELNQTQAAKNRMYAQISHEIKSPLQAIKSQLSKESAHSNNDENQRIKSNINNLLDISNEIMELSKAESGNLKIKRNWYNINGIISDQIELKMPLAEAKNLNIIHPQAKNNQYLEIDISLIQKAINNLLSNAIKFSPSGSNITIESTIQNDTHRIAVIDHGAGVPTDEIEHLTLAYYQASNNNEDGTGIGLSLVQEILKLHGSQLQIQSTLNQGSTFSFELKRPKITQKQIVERHINPAKINSQIDQIVDKSKPIILAVDDSEDVLYFIKQSLQSCYSIITARNGQEALVIIDLMQPQVIISDYNMPLMNGFAFLQQVRKIAKFDTTPFLFLTGTQSEESAILSIKAGADTILQKPIDEEMLITQVAKSIARQRTIEASLKTSLARKLLPANMQNDDKELMLTLESIFLQNVSNGSLKSNEIAGLVGLGEKTLRNRVKTITGMTVKELFKNFRLEKARLLLEQGYTTKSEVALATGFNSLSNFNKSYKTYFG